MTYQSDNGDSDYRLENLRKLYWFLRTQTPREEIRDGKKVPVKYPVYSEAFPPLGTRESELQQIGKVIDGVFSNSWDEFSNSEFDSFLNALVNGRAANIQHKSYVAPGSAPYKYSAPRRSVSDNVREIQNKSYTQAVDPYPLQTKLDESVKWLLDTLGTKEQLQDMKDFGGDFVKKIGQGLKDMEYREYLKRVSSSVNNAVDSGSNTAREALRVLLDRIYRRPM